MELWSEDIKWRSNLEIDADSFNRWSSSVLSPITDGVVPLSLDQTYANGKPIGKEFRFALVKFPKECRRSGLFSLEEKTVKNRLSTIYGSQLGTCWFTDEVVFPHLSCAPRVAVMSLTPFELFTCRPGIRRAKGNVFMAGLGLGFMAHRILQKKTVTRLTIVEKDFDVIRVFGSRLENLYNCKRLDIIHADFYEYAKGKGKLKNYDSIIMDIWMKFGDARRDQKAKELTKDYPCVWMWGNPKNNG